MTSENSYSAAESAPSPHGSDWKGRFPRNGIISLLDVNRPFNLAESTSRNLSVEDLLDLIDIRDIHSVELGYGSSAGDPALRELIAESCAVAPAHVLTTPGGAFGIFLLAFELCRPGDEVIFTSPGFPPSRDVITACGAELKEVKLAFSDGYQVSASRIGAAMSPRTKLISLASPQNPSGVRVPTSTLAELLDMMTLRAPQALLLVDETYREAVYELDAAPSSVASMDPRIVTCSSVSKALGAPGLRVGWLTLASAALRERLTVAKMNTVISGSVLDETLATALLRHKHIILGVQRAHLSTALGEVAQWQEQEQHRLDWIQPDAGALCCSRIRDDALGDDAVSRFWAVLADHHVQLAPGSWFGVDDRVFRIGFGHIPPDRLRPALHAVSRALDQALADTSSP